MKRFDSLRWFMVLAVSAVLSAGCGAAAVDKANVDAAAAARSKVQRNWKMQIDWEGSPADLALDRMDIFLVDEEDHFPEIFEIHGPDAVLVGQFPMDTHVGYQSEYKNLIGRTIQLRRSGGDPREPKSSFVRVGGKEMLVIGGTFTVEKFTGKWEGSEGDKTYWGTVELRVPAAEGEQVIHGKFAVNCVTWS